MDHVFISYVEEDADVVAEISRSLEVAGLATWFYERDSLPGPSYLAQIAAAVEQSRAVIVIISPNSIGSEQVTSEIVRGFELGKPFVPLLRGISHPDFQRKQPEWRGALRAATSSSIPPEGVAVLLPRILRGLEALGVVPRGRPQPTAASPALASGTAGTTPAFSPGLGLHLTADFDHEAYPAGEDSLAYCLAELLLTAAGEAPVEGADADLALILDVSGSMDKPNRYPLLCQAVRQLVAGLGSTDRISITLFSDRSETVVPLLWGADAAEQAGHIVASMNRSKLLFGPQTLLAPALGLALESLGPGTPEPGRVRRVYVLTDGELHDTPACEAVLGEYRPRRTEVHVYGFGDEFNAAALKRLVSDQLGGTVKPICNEPDIVRTFAHLARVNRRLVGQEGRLTVTFSPEVVCGDAWVFRPAGRYLGTIRDHRLEHLFGGLETGRAYSLLLECRLPVADRLTQTPVAEVRASWLQEGKQTAHAIKVAARRVLPPPPAGPLPAVPLVKLALDALNALRDEQDVQAVLASLKARRELALLESRDPNLIAALDKMIASLDDAAAGKTVEEARAELSDEEELYLDSDLRTWTD